jgi:hypothetical protein
VQVVNAKVYFCFWRINAERAKCREQVSRRKGQPGQGLNKGPIIIKINDSPKIRKKEPIKKDKREHKG